MKFSKLALKTFILAGALMAFSSTATAGEIIIKKRPPAVKVEVKTKKPFKKAVWAPGHWIWTGNRYVWKKGHWIRVKKGHAWVNGHYKRHKNGWVWVAGRWKKN